MGLPIIHLGLIVLVACGMYYHAIYDTGILSLAPAGLASVTSAVARSRVRRLTPLAAYAGGTADAGLRIRGPGASRSNSARARKQGIWTSYGYRLH